MRDETLRWLWEVPGKRKRIVAALTAAQLGSGLMGVVTALALRYVVDSAVSQDVSAFRNGVILIILIIAVQQGLYALIRWLTELGKSSVENVFKERLTENVLCRSYASVSAVHSGEWLNRLTNDTKVVADGYTEILPGLAGMSMQLISALVMIIALDSRFAVVILPGGILLILLSYIIRKTLKTLHKKVQEEDGKLRVFLQERLSSLMIIKSFSAEEQTLREAAEKMENHKAARMRKNRFSNFCNAGFGTAMQGMYLLGACYCAWGILKSTLSYGTLTAEMQLLSQIHTPFANISNFLPRFYAMLASAERLREAEQIPADLDGPALTRAEVSELYEERMAAFGLQHADYTYLPIGTGEADKRKEHMPVVLKDLTLWVRKGEYVAFTGHSGCGKSTVLKLLMSMYALDGGTKSILCRDGAEIPLTAEYRRLFAYVPQGNALMNGTIREVVSFSETGSVDEERLKQALRIACADGFVRDQERGTDTLLGERGTGLSEGQMQRIAIARALYSEAPVLLLDESTSALDAKTEAELLVNLKSLTDRTVIIVTHRPAALAICDRVLEFTESGVKET